MKSKPITFGALVKLRAIKPEQIALDINYSYSSILKWIDGATPHRKIRPAIGRLLKADCEIVGRDVLWKPKVKGR